MLKNTWISIKNFLQTNKGNSMERKTITFEIVASIVKDSEHAWLRNVRQIRKTMKQVLQQYPDIKILKIDSKES